MKFLLKSNDNIETESKNDQSNHNIQLLNTESKNDLNFRDFIAGKYKRRNNLEPIRPSAPKPLNKNEMFNYFKFGIFSRDPQKKPTEKIILVLDEFKKIFIVKCHKLEESPFVIDFDLKLYPQVNIRNMNEILMFKNF